MSVVAIPAWNSLGLLPPVDPELPTSPKRSPYQVALMDVVMRFSTSTERVAVVNGFLRYRAELHRLGIRDGFQWLDGSFTENVEVLEHRAPRDIDVVSFFHTPKGFELNGEDLHLFDQAETKTRFNVDAYFVEFDQVTPRELTFWSAYWYSMWSHRRTQSWKGFLQVDLAPTEDASALAWLAQFEPTGGNA